MSNSNSTIKNSNLRENEQTTSNHEISKTNTFKQKKITKKNIEEIEKVWLESETQNVELDNKETDNLTSVQENATIGSINTESNPYSKEPSNYKVSLKLFERSFSFDHFTQDTPLYPICRAWFANENPKFLGSKFNNSNIFNSPLERPNNGETLLKEFQSGFIKHISIMPATAPRTNDFEASKLPTLESLGYEDKRDISTLNEFMATQSENEGDCYAAINNELLAQHKQKWKKVKSNWIKHSRNYQKHFEVNFSILEILYKSQMNIDANLTQDSQPSGIDKN